MTATHTSTWRALAKQVFEAHPSVASVSIVSRELAAAFGHGSRFGGTVLQTSAAVLPQCVTNERMAGLLGPGELRERITSASLRGLHHAWIVVTDGGATDPGALVPATAGDDVVIASLPIAGAEAKPVAVGIDAAWLLGGESGAQVFVFETLRAMAKSGAIDRVVLLSDSGGVPAALAGTAKISGRTWADALASGDRLDVLHRPYQPGADVELERYRQVAHAVVITVLDFIAYDNPAYHESLFAFRAYRRSFDDQICRADQILAISRHIGDRIQRQFAHRLLAPIRSIYPGANHLEAAASSGAVPPSLAGVAPGQYLAVLGNDFAHKNRDFAVKVFTEMCRHGYRGLLVLAGFHLDAGSSYGYELAGAGEYRDRVRRVGPLSPDHKKWLLQHAQAVLYPTSSEGFGLIPFEAAALGTPTAFVRFGPLVETLPDVPAAPAWDVTAFAAHVFSLLEAPADCVEAVRRAGQRLTWERCAAETIAVYQDLLRDSAPWHAAVAERRGPGAWMRLKETAAEYWRRAGGKVRRVTGRTSRERE